MNRPSGHDEEKYMHYKNGREAKNGDKVVLVPEYPKDASGKSLAIPVVGVLYDATPGNDFCNGKIAPIAPNDPMPNLKECLHLDDVLKALATPLPDSTPATTVDTASADAPKATTTAG